MEGRFRLTYANVMATLAVVIAVGGGAVAVGGLSDGDGEIEACFDKKGQDKGDLRVLLKGECKRRRERPIAWNQVGPQGEPGPQGLQGEPGSTGPPGQDATNLFAYIRDNGDGTAAVREYGTGVTGVTEGGSPGVYTVAFDRSITGCVVHADAGIGDPPGAGSSSTHSAPDIRLNEGAANEVSIVFRNLGETNVDTSFLVSAFC